MPPLKIQYWSLRIWSREFFILLESKETNIQYKNYVDEQR